MADGTHAVQGVAAGRSLNERTIPTGAQGGQVAGIPGAHAEATQSGPARPTNKVRRAGRRNRSGSRLYAKFRANSLRCLRQNGVDARLRPIVHERARTGSQQLDAVIIALRSPNEEIERQLSDDARARAMFTRRRKLREGAERTRMPRRKQ